MLIAHQLGIGIRQLQLGPAQQFDLAAFFSIKLIRQLVRNDQVLGKNRRADTHRAFGAQQL